MKKLLALILILTCVAVFGQGYPAYRPNSPLTAAEKTQALVGSSTVDFSAKNVTALEYSQRTSAAAIPGWSEHLVYTANIAASGGTKTYVFTRTTAEDMGVGAQFRLSAWYGSTVDNAFVFSGDIAFAWQADGTVAGLATNTAAVGNTTTAPTISGVVGSGTTELQITITNPSASTLTQPILWIEFVGRRQAGTTYKEVF